ncbi:MAG TPA: isoprenylcysteine carboxylmethyltransferase family protein [Anaerolineales bacterium]|nr:isoprenylcysteine carboxylmethyltransferase family protein [Anaerolineales bacterium]
MTTKRIMPTTYLLIAILAMIAIHFLFPLAMIVPPGWNLLGLLPLALGVVINLAADEAFRRAKTTVKPFEESSVLVQSGVFRISRNPMYLGFVLSLIGIAVLLRSLSPYLLILAFVILIQTLYITVEERMLGEKFGARWQDYKRTTRRWL